MLAPAFGCGGSDEAEGVDEAKQAQQRGGRRGRRPTRPDPDSGPAGRFADRLWRLKQEAGDPSYEEMSGRLGAAASKSSLAAAAQGRSLPSWETTWEFVRVLEVGRLGRDPHETEVRWRELWEQAKAAAAGAGAPAAAGRAVLPEPTAAGEQVVGTPQPAVAVGPASKPAPAPGPPVPVPVPAAAVVRSRWNRRSIGLTGVAALLAGIAGSGLVFFLLGWSTGRGSTVPTAPPTPRAVDPVERDDSRFEGDITYPDGTLVPPDTEFKKVWRIRNTGTVIWHNRRLARINEAPCAAPTSVDVPDARPGEAVDIAVVVRAPKKPAKCKVFWKMVDDQGRTLFPAKRPVFLEVRVGAS